MNIKPRIAILVGIPLLVIALIPTVILVNQTPPTTTTTTTSTTTPAQNFSQRTTIFEAMQNDVINQVALDQQNGTLQNGVDGDTYCGPYGEQGYGDETPQLRATTRYETFDCWIHNAGAAEAYGTTYKAVVDFKNGTWTLTLEQ